MKHFKSTDNKVYAFEEDGSQDHLIQKDMISITIDEVIELTKIIFTTEQVAENIKNKRNALILLSDWTQLLDVPTTTRDKWVVYRQTLRDITNQEGFPLTIDWPVTPV